VYGLTRADAAHLLNHGWRKDTIKTIHGWMGKAGVNVEDLVSYWGLHMNNGLLLYRGYAPEDVDRAFEPLVRLDREQEIVIYTDGSGTQPDKPAGIGVVVFWPGKKPELIAENIGLGTNNRAELAAIWRGLQAIPDIRQKILIRSDSEYAMGSSSQPWMPKKNVAIIEAVKVDLAKRQGRVEFRHVNGHAGVAGNEIADSLAKIGRKYITQVSKFEE
jgi:ribonuclease HI